MRLFPFPHATLYVLQLEHSPQLSNTFSWKEKPTTFATHKDSWNKKRKRITFQFEGNMNSVEGTFLSYSSQRRAGVTTRRLAWRIPQSFEICWRTTRAPRVKRHSRISHSSATRFLRGSTNVDSREEALGHARARFLHVPVHFWFKEVFKQTNDYLSVFHGTLGCGNNLLMKMSLF